MKRHPGVQAFIGLCLVWCSVTAPVQAGTMTIAAAADLKFAMDILVERFRKDRPNDEVHVIYGSSGRFFNQIRSGAPFDLYFSADIDYPRILATDGLTASPVHRYAIGRIVVWTRKVTTLPLTLDVVSQNDVRRVAIANPQHAPYGKRAEEALRALGLWEGVEKKLVYGENIAQTAQFALTGNAEVAVLALSLVLHPPLSIEGRYALIPEALHKPLEQGFVVTERAADNALARQFEAYVATDDARQVLAENGFSLPEERKPDEARPIKP